MTGDGYLAVSLLVSFVVHDKTFKRLARGYIVVRIARAY